MSAKSAFLVVACLGAGACAPRPAHEGVTTGASLADPRRAGASPTEPLVVGESFTLDSRVLAERRRVNVFIPTIYGQKLDVPLPVLFMPDGGLDEDFLHVAGLVQVLVSNGGMRPVLLVGIPNTQRRRDLTGPTSIASDRAIAPRVGESAAFRRFIREELMPAVRARYRTTDGTAIIGESLAGLFAVETFFLEPQLFDAYIAIDPSLWWAGAELVRKAPERLAALAASATTRSAAGDDAGSATGRTLLVVTSNEPDMVKLAGELAEVFASHRVNGSAQGAEGAMRCAPGVSFQYLPLPAESHATIYHPAALLALRTVLSPPARDGK